MATEAKNTAAEVRTSPDGQLIVTWGDGHVSTYALAAMRRECRCGVCRPGVTDYAADLAAVRPQVVKLARGGLLASMWVLGVGWLFLWADTETVVASGPALCLVAVWLFIMGWSAGYRWVRTMAVSHVTFVIFLAVLVESNNWSPRAAQGPFLVLGGIYAAAAGAAAWWLYRNPPPVKVEPSWHCRKCGYLLVGLAEDRCPECGEGFDRADLPAGPPAGVESAVR